MRLFAKMVRSELISSPTICNYAFLKLATVIFQMQQYESRPTSMLTTTWTHSTIKRRPALLHAAFPRSSTEVGLGSLSVAVYVKEPTIEPAR